MDELLELRYTEIFRAYDVHDRGALLEIKKRLEAAIEPPEYRTAIPWLRADAALCLLTLCDQMIIRPYSGVLETASYPKGIAPPFAPESFRDHLERSGIVILTALKKVRSEGPYSSHDVLKAINLAWPDLATLFGWG